ncbi:unnamed protein product [Dicrocoelium dendriticum]|nr:unnamed protein product [Dicrocoelium dendriticum]
MKAPQAGACRLKLLRAQDDRRHTRHLPSWRMLVGDSLVCAGAACKGGGLGTLLPHSVGVSGSRGGAGVVVRRLSRTEARAPVASRGCWSWGEGGGGPTTNHSAYLLNSLHKTMTIKKSNPDIHPTSRVHSCGGGGLHNQGGGEAGPTFLTPTRRWHNPGGPKEKEQI